MSHEHLQHLAEDSAYQFKGLHKTADIYHYLFRISIILILLIGVSSLAFSFGEAMSRMLGALALLLSIVLLIYQKDTERVKDYRRHADKFKNVYDELERRFHNNEQVSEDLIGTIYQLRGVNAEFPISVLARWWAAKVIHKEMNLKWLRD